MNDLMQLWDQHPIIPLVIFLFICYLIGRKRRQLKADAGDTLSPSRVAASNDPVTSSSGPAPSHGDLLSHVLFHWRGKSRDPFPIRDLLRSVAIFGASGSGKTSGSGYQLMKALARCKKIGGLILASKPEDREMWQRIFHQAGRLRDLVIFNPQNSWRFNFIDFIHKNGGDARDITEAIMVIGETLEQGESREHNPFWKQQKTRTVHSAVEITRGALGKVSAPVLQQFISGAAQSPAELATPAWQAKFHSQCLERACQNARTSVERHDYQLASEFWIKEYPAMNDRTRSSIIADVMGTLHVFNQGIVRELVSTTTNVSPIIMDHGMWILMDMPISSYGAAGALILGGMKYLTQRYILHRYTTDDTAATVIWADEYQKVANSFDPPFLAECRSHRGSMVVLTQSVHALYTRIQQAGEHGTDALLTNFYHKVFHAIGDDKTAAYASSLIGKRLKTRVNVSSSSGDDNAYDALYGQPKVSASTTQSIENILENREFMQGLRTGGAANGYVVDGIVVRSGEPFSTGENYVKASFSQR